MVDDNRASPGIKKAIQKRRLARSVVMSANGTSGKSARSQLSGNGVLSGTCHKQLRHGEFCLCQDVDFLDGGVYVQCVRFFGLQRWRFEQHQALPI